MTLPELEQVLKWYQTPLGKKISETELEKYIAFSETAAGRHFYSLLRKKTNIVLLDSNKKILTSIVRVMNDDSWDNIRKDLGEPIREI